MKLPLIPLDKANHFIYGFVIFIIGQCFLNDYYSIGIVFLVALGNEIKDQIDYKGFDYKDIIVTMIPSIILYYIR